MRPGQIKRRSAPHRATAIRTQNRKRKASEFARVYGSKERVAWIRSQACIACVAEGGVIWAGCCENAHTETDGLGRKAGYETIIPLCRRHHRQFDEHRAPFDNPPLREQAKQIAAQYEAAWQSHLRQTGRARQETE